MKMSYFERIPLKYYIYTPIFGWTFLHVQFWLFISTQFRERETSKCHVLYGAWVKLETFIHGCLRKSKNSVLRANDTHSPKPWFELLYFLKKHRLYDIIFVKLQTKYCSLLSNINFIQHWGLRGLLLYLSIARTEQESGHSHGQVPSTSSCWLIYSRRLPLACSVYKFSSKLR